MVNLLVITKVSEFLNERTLVSKLCLFFYFPRLFIPSASCLAVILTFDMPKGLSMELWALPCLIALRAWPNNINFNKWGKFVTLTVLNAYPYPHAILVGWCSKNSNTVRTRTVSAAVYNST
jgi:hypothetical protein